MHAFIHYSEMSFSIGEIKDGVLRIGNTEVAVHNPDLSIKVPDVLFYENPQVSDVPYKST